MTERTRCSLTHIQVVNREEGLSLSSLLFYNLNAVTAHFCRGHHDGVHVMAKHLCDSELVFLVDGLTQVHQASILDAKREKKKKNLKIKNKVAVTYVQYFMRFVLTFVCYEALLNSALRYTVFCIAGLRIVNPKHIKPLK